MNQDTMEQSRGQSKYVPLKNLYLDPNNFRFVDHPDYRPVPAERVFDPDVQRRTTRLVLGRFQEHVQDLVASIQENGWLEMDPILVRRREAGRYLVIEGNRRVATLQYLRRRHDEDAIDLGRLDPGVFSRVRVALYEDSDERKHLVMMGLHHISGKRRWPAINRARAMKHLFEQFGGDADAVCRALGVHKRDFNLSVRTLALVDAYRNSDYGDQFQSDQYNLFREILRSPPLRDWLEWDDLDRVARNEANLPRLFSWMSRDEDSNDDEETAGDLDGLKPREPVVTTGGHIRELGRIIEDPAAVRLLDETRSLQEATLSSGLLVKTEIDGAFTSCEKGIHKLVTRAGELDPAALDRVEELIGKLHGVALARKRRPPGAGSGAPWQPFNEITRSGFSSIDIQNYRGIGGIVLDSPGRINLVVGVNNAGKTSLLEAIHLLAHQNDERSLFDTLRWRRRIEGEPDPVWLSERLPAGVRISGTFDQIPSNNVTLAVDVVEEPEDDIQNQTGFLAQVLIEGNYGGLSQSTEVVLFEDRPRRTHYQGRHWLCHAAFTSPFWSSRPETLARCHEESVKAGTKETIIRFIKEQVDPGVRNIELVGRDNQFRVAHDDFALAPDLSSFGEGMRRVFEIGLLFASARGGVLLIDEFENAIHTELLARFTGLVRELADCFDVQVFLTTHSKEAIDAWVTNGGDADGVVGYALVRTADGALIRRFDGRRLKHLHEILDFDLRGVR